MISKILATLATAAVLCTSTALAGDIYRYTDDEGNVAYVDRPSAQPGGERVNIASSSTDIAALQARAQARTASTETAEDRRQARAEEARVAKAEKAARQEREDRCQIARNRMETLVTSRHLFRQDENGERSYLDAAQIQDARDKVEAQIEETCD